MSAQQFLTIAGRWKQHVEALQFVAKVAGGAIWAWVLTRTAQRATA